MPIKPHLFILVTAMMTFAATMEGVTWAHARGIDLPALPKAGGLSLDEALARRRSVREFSLEALTLADISRLAWAAQGLTGPGHRTAPSAGATYPLEVYLAAGNVENLSTGVYRYLPQQHRLEGLFDGDIRVRLADCAGQEWLSRAPAIVVIAAVFDRTTARYGERGKRYVHMEAGHAAQNLLLQAAALGLGATPVGAFNDGELSRLLHLPAGETPLYLIPVGRPSRP